MNDISDLQQLEKGRNQPWVRQAYKILERAHVSVKALFSAADALDSARRQANGSPKGRKSVSEVDILRSAIVLTSAGLDASMKRLVNDVGRELILKKATVARRNYELYLKNEMEKPSTSEPFRQAVLADNPREKLLSFYLAEKTKASFQGSGDLIKRVKKVLGIPNGEVSDSSLKKLDPFFEARNKIVHDMDLKDTTTKSIARVHRDSGTVAAQCNTVFDAAVFLIRGAAKVCWEAGGSP